MREPHLRALAKLFDKFAKQLHHFSKPYQLWIYLNAGDSAGDALFVHTPNLNQSEFPLIFKNARWNVSKIEEYFGNLLPEYEFQAGTEIWRGADIYFVYAKGAGIPLKSAN